MTKAGLTVFFLLPVLAAPLPATAQDAAQKTPPRTVTWYADNPQARAQVELACIDDPGHLANDPDCINAQQAGVEVALRDVKNHGVILDPRDPAFWSSDPQNRHNYLLMCSRNPELDYCDVAKRSLLIEAGKAAR